ncbi:hypothetical protein Tco_0492618 [Tanacetum coccineum]
MLEFEYSNCDDPSTLWKDLEIRFNNQREVLLPSARDEWNNLRFQDFKKVNEYTSALFRISEKNNELLMKNHQSRPTGSLALPEANAVNNNNNKNSGSKKGRVAHVHTQNGLAESLIKRLQLIARPLIMRTKLPVSMWGHAILHAASLIRIRPSADHKYSPIQYLLGQEPNISHLEFVVVPVDSGAANDQRMQKLIESNDKYADDMSEDEISKDGLESDENDDNEHVNCENKDLQLSNGSHFENTCRRHDLDKNPCKRKGTEKNSDHEENVLDETQDIKTLPEEEMNDMNKEMSINYSQTNILWDRNEIGDIDEILSYFVASDIMGGDDDPEPKVRIDVKVDQIGINGKTLCKLN